MPTSAVLKVAAFLFVLGLVALLYWLTLVPEEDPCASPGSDIGAAVLAEENGDQEALVNRAIIVKGNCKQREGGKSAD
tara:strand:+ start:2831 stop:3064 length:234 start_codon:yes stop_codon:yes gene_type:complete